MEIWRIRKRRYRDRYRLTSGHKGASAVIISHYLTRDDDIRVIMMASNGSIKGPILGD